MHQNKQIKIPLLIGGLVLIITLGFGIGVALSVSKNISTLTSNTSSSLLNTYKDGTYTANGSYRTPGGTESIDVTVSIKNQIITSVDVSDKATDEISQKYNQKFIKGISGVVVGKSITTNFAPRVVNGASITINGFDKALSAIRTQALN